VAASGGMTPLHFAVRQGYTDITMALLDAGVDVNLIKGGDNASPLLIATVNGHFDLGSKLLARGANPNLAGENGVTPLYAVINLKWAQEAGYPQPWAQLDQKITYLDYMKLLLEKGADPNARVTKKVWYSGYNFDLSGIDEVGATPFWRAAYGADVEAMKLLVSHGADPNIPTAKPPGRPRTGDADIRQMVDVSGLPEIPTGGPGVSALHAAAGAGYSEGFAANSHRYAPSGLLAAVKYMVDELHMDVNLRDHEGNTPLHHAASRGDNEMILFLVSKGADVKAVTREGRTTADMANGPVQRIQPWPEALALLEKLGAKNNHKCVSC
jgi:ankyrin repeat protein